MEKYEKAYFGAGVSYDKPYNAIMSLRQNSNAFNTVKQLLDSLLDHTKQPPSGAVEWTSIEQLEEYLSVSLTQSMVAGGDEKVQDNMVKNDLCEH
jgi:putative ATP-dependent endonuclease of OLD family